MRISLLALPVILLLSCSISDRLVYEDAEGVVPDSFFSSIKNNKTQKTWIIDNLGEPHLSVSGTNQGEVLTYQFTQSRYRKTSLLLVTHDKRLAARMDQQLELHLGRLREME